MDGCAQRDGSVASVMLTVALFMMMDAGWALTVFRFSMVVFFVMGLITALLACVHVAIDVGGGEARKFFGYG